MEDSTLVSNQMIVASNSSYLRHGRVVFKNSQEQADENPLFLCVDSETDMLNVCRFMEEVWMIGKPTIVLQFITGILQQGTLASGRHWKQLEEGLMKSADKTSMWIVTNGLDWGIAKALGLRVNEERTWLKASTCTKHGKHFISSIQNLILLGIVREETLKYANVNGWEDRVEVTKSGNEPESMSFELNPHHTHYIIVKDHARDGSGIERFILNLIDVLKNSIEVAEINGEAAHQPKLELAGSKIPLIGLMIGGGLNSLKMVYGLLDKHVPVTVVKGSGYAADCLAFAFEEIKRRAALDQIILTELARKLSLYFTEDPMEFIELITSCVEIAVQHSRAFLTILDIYKPESDLSLVNEHLMRALFRAQRRYGVDEQWDCYLIRDLNLALDWNIPHVCLVEIFANDNVKYEIGSELFERGIKRVGRETFVELFLDNGFQVGHHLDENTFFRLFLEAENRQFFEEIALGSGLISPLTDSNLLIYEINRFLFYVADIRFFVNLHHDENEVDEGLLERRALYALIMFAVLMNRPKLAKVLWKRAPYPIHLGILISILYKRLADALPEYPLHFELKNLSREFAKMSIRVLDISYNAQHCRAIDILSKEVSDYDYKTAVEMAATARLRHFLAHSCCQKWLETQFLGEIRIRPRPAIYFKFPTWLKITLSAFLVFPVDTWIFFKTKKSSYDQLIGRYGRGGELTVSHEDIELMCVDQTNNKLELGHHSLIPVVKSHSSHYCHSDESICFETHGISEELPLWKKISMLWNAPAVKYWTHQVFYILYLILFSVTVLWPSCGHFYLDITLWLWTLTILMEQCYITYMHYKHFSSKSLVGSVIDIYVIYLFLLLMLFVRIFSSYEFSETIGYLPKLILKGYGARVVMCLGLVYFFCRFIWIYFPISNTLGIFLYRLKEMVVNDFVQFLRLAILFIVSYGIAIHSVIYPDFPMSWELIRRVFHRAWFTLFLSPVDDLNGDIYCSVHPYSGNDFCRIGPYANVTCPVTGAWPYIFTVSYFIIIKLILLTVLFAIFASTASRLEADSDAIWRYQRYHIVLDFYVRPRLPPPLNIVSLVIIFFTRVYKCCYRLSKRWREKNEKWKSSRRKKDDKSDPMADYYWRRISEMVIAEEEQTIYEENWHKRQSARIEHLVEVTHLLRSLVQDVTIRQSKIEKAVDDIEMSLIDIKLYMAEPTSIQVTHETVRD
ncbi:hypothetical protein CHUAL_002132 [Chamberlinius hualienensis]